MKNQKGFVVLIIVVLVVILVLGTGGFLIYKNYSNLTQNIGLKPLSQIKPCQTWIDFGKAGGIGCLPKGKNTAIFIKNNLDEPVAIGFDPGGLDTIQAKAQKTIRLGIEDEEILVRPMDSNGNVLTKADLDQIFYKVLSSVPVQTLTSSSASSNFEGWKTYKDNKYGLEFDYPSNWTVTLNKYLDNPNEAQMNQIEVNFTPEKENSNSEASRGYQAVVQVQDLKDLSFKNQDDLYKSQLDDFGKIGWTVFKFDFQGEKGVGVYQYTPADSNGNGGCGSSISVFHNGFLFNLPITFGDFINYGDLKKCSDTVKVSPDFKRIISTFKFTNTK
jgi:hypothetical protein